MVQEEVENKTVRLAVTTTKLSVRCMCKALSTVHEKYKKKKEIKKTEKKSKDTRIKGKQTVKQLSGQGQRMSSMEIGDESVRDFFRLVKKYGVDYAIVKDNSGEQEKYTVFFKANDTDVFGSIVNECVNRQLKKEGKEEEKKPSILEMLKKAKEALSMIPKDREKIKEIQR